MNNPPENASPVAWIFGVWTMVGISSWSEAASCAAFLITMYLLLRHIFRDLVRPFLESIGWMKPRYHVRTIEPDEVLERIE